LGAELLARELNFAIVFAEINRVKRGHYETEFKVLTDNPKATKPNEITDLFTDWVEAQVYSDPSQYLWSHNRFKHSHLAPKD
ncbi:MAG: LpxL/LpxP family acyltransferase, partial [Flavobacteriales bacterium]